MLGVAIGIITSGICVCIYFNCRQPHHVYVTRKRVPRKPKRTLISSAIDDLYYDFNSLIGGETIEIDRVRVRDDRSINVNRL